ncbi:histidine kinase [Heyndrickxia sporothermodurans]
MIRQTFGNIYFIIVSLTGFGLFLSSLFSISPINNGLVYGILLFFMIILELFPARIGNTSSSFTFSLLFTMNQYFSLSLTTATFFATLTMIYVFQKRRWKMIIFNAAQLTICFIAAHYCTEFVLGHLELISSEFKEILKIVAFTSVFYICNNLLFDLLCLIYPKSYTKEAWLQKSVRELIVCVIEMLYLILIQGIGAFGYDEKKDVISLFFFMPLAILSIISSSYAKIWEEKWRLLSLVNISTELNQMFPSSDKKRIRRLLKQFLKSSSYALYIKEEWYYTYWIGDGQVKYKEEILRNLPDSFQEQRLLVSQELRKLGFTMAGEMKQCLVSPIIFEGEHIGFMIVAKGGIDTFSDGEIRSIKAIANQMASLLKTQSLKIEQEKNLILEERNRIAREIHDGMAQSLAGLVFELELSVRQREQGNHVDVIHHAIDHLRMALRELRQSIYELRPNPNANIGLIDAIKQKLAQVDKQYPHNISVKVKGKSERQPFHVEKVIYNIFQESIQNIIKHANAGKIDVQLLFKEEAIVIKIKDDGKGFSLFEALIKGQKEPHIGLLSMQEQAESIQSELEIDSSPNKGTLIMLKVPNKGSVNDDKGVDCG